MRFILAYIALVVNLNAGEVLPGSVPGTIVYQGRIEKNNAPVNGIIHINFRIYGSQSGSDILWESGYQTAEARAGIFSITLSPPLNIFAQGNQRYIEIEVEGERLTPREQINSVIYSMIAKKLEDGSSVHLSSAVVGTILTSYPNYSGQKLIVYGGGIYTDQICFYPYGNCMSAPGEASVTSTLFSSGTVRIRSDIDNNLSGDIIFETRGINEVARFSNNGNFGIGTTNPVEKLDVSGNIHASGDINASNINFSGILNNGLIRGLNLEQISLGVNNDRIDFVVNNTTTVVINGSNLGIGITTPSYSVDVAGGIRSFSIQTSTINLTGEIKNTSGHISLQSSSIYNVGIGTITPSEKLHVAGVIRADEGILTTSATFLSDVNIDGNLKVTKYGKKIELSSTTVYGTLNVVGELNVNQDKIAALASTQTFSGRNTYLSSTFFSSNIYLTDGIAVFGSNKESFGIGKYLQIGNPLSVGENSVIYLAGGSDALSSIMFYNGQLNKVAEVSAVSNKLVLKHSNSNDIKLIIDSSSTTFYGPSVAISTSYLSSPALYINSSGNVGIGTISPGDRLVVNGDIRLQGSGSKIIFSDGSILTSSSSISVGAISNNSDAVIYADSDMNGSGSIIMKTNNINAAFINNSGKIGLGTINPQEKLHVIGDVLIGNTSNPYNSDNKNDLIVEGNVVVDGSIEQRSSIPVKFESLYVRGDVFLSTSSFSKTGIGTLNPSEKLDISGNINLSGDLKISGTPVITSLRTLTNLTGITSSGNIIFSSLSPSRLVATDGSKNLVSSITSDNLASSVTDETGSGLLVFNTNPTFQNSITVSGSITASSGTFTQTGNYSIITSSGISVNAGSIVINSLTASRLVATDGSKKLVSSITSDNLASSVTDETGSGLLVFNTNPTFQNSITVSGSITASSGTFTQTGNYSITASSGISVNSGIINLNSAVRIKNSLDPVDNQDLTTKSYVDNKLLIGGTEPNSWQVTGNNAGANRVIGTTNSQSFKLITANTDRIVFYDTGLIEFTNNVPHTTFSKGITASSGTFTQTGNYSIITSSGISVNAGSIVINSLTASRLVATDGSKKLVSSITSDNLASSVTDETGSGLLVFNTNPTFQNSITVSGSITASSGTFINAAGTPRLNLASNVFISSASSSNYGGVYISTHLYLTSGARYYGNGSEITSINPANISSGILPSNVVASSITINTVYTESIQNGAVTDSKISSVSASKITSGTLTLSRGGTGADLSTASDGAVIKSGSSFSSLSGLTGTFTVAKSTNPAGGCVELDFQYGILISTKSLNCP